MEENLFLLSSFIYLLVVVYLLDFWNARTVNPRADSETNARTRYSIAEMIESEFER